MGFISDITKANYAWKKFNNKQHTSNDKAAYEEQNGLLANVHKTNIWTGDVPATAPADTADSTVLEKVTITMTEDITVSGRKSWFAEDDNGKIGNFVNSSFGSTYGIVLKIGGTKVPSSDSSRWTFDYETGVLWFENSPTSGAITIDAYKYIGETLADSVSGDSTKIKGGSVVEGDLTIEGDLTVLGENVILNTTELTVEDNVITLNKGTTGEPTENAGLEIDRGDEGTLQLIQWNEETDTVQINQNGNMVNVATSNDIFNLKDGLDNNSTEGDDGASMIGYAGLAVTTNGNVVLTSGTVDGGINQLAQIIDDMKQDDKTSIYTGIQGDETPVKTYTISHNLDSEFLDIALYGKIDGVWTNMMIPYDLVDTNTIEVELSTETTIKYTITKIS